MKRRGMPVCRIKNQTYILDADLLSRSMKRDRDPAASSVVSHEAGRNAIDADHIARSDRRDPVVGHAFDELESAQTVDLRPETSGTSGSEATRESASAKSSHPCGMASLFSWNKTGNQRTVERVNRMIESMWFCMKFSFLAPASSS